MPHSATEEHVEVKLSDLLTKYVKFYESVFSQQSHLPGVQRHMFFISSPLFIRYGQ